MRISSRAVVIEDNKLLTMFRRKIKDGVKKEYFVIPGGGLEEGETLEQNVVRELAEEMNVDVKILGYLGKTEDEELCQHYFHCEIVKGTPHLGGEELERMTESNYYKPTFVEIEDIENIDIFGIEFVKKALRKEYVKNK